MVTGDLLTATARGAFAALVFLKLSGACDDPPLPSSRLWPQPPPPPLSVLDEARDWASPCCAGNSARREVTSTNEAEAPPRRDAQPRRWLLILVTARRSSARRWLFFPPVRSRESLAVPFLSLLLPLRPSLTTSPMARTYTICVPRPERPSSHRLHQEVARAPQSQPAPNGTHPLSPEAVAPGSPSHQRPHCPLRLHPPPPKPIPTLPPFSSPISTSNHLKSLSGHPNFSLPLYHSLSQALAFSQLDELTN